MEEIAFLIKNANYFERTVIMNNYLTSIVVNGFDRSNLNDFFPLFPLYSSLIIFFSLFF